MTTAFLEQLMIICMLILPAVLFLWHTSRFIFCSYEVDWTWQSRYDMSILPSLPNISFGILIFGFNLWKTSVAILIFTTLILAAGGEKIWYHTNQTSLKSSKKAHLLIFAFVPLATTICSWLGVADSLTFFLLTSWFFISLSTILLPITAIYNLIFQL